MEFQNLIEKRRSVRKYVERNTVTKDEILSMIKAAQEAPSWKNSQTGRYYCIMDEKNVEQFRRECLPEMNAGKCENAVLLVSTFVHNRAGFQKDGTADNEIGNGWGCYDLGLQNENLILKAEELGYGTLIMGIRDADKIREFCSVPEPKRIVWGCVPLLADFPASAFLKTRNRAEENCLELRPPFSRLPSLSFS